MQTRSPCQMGRAGLFFEHQFARELEGCESSRSRVKPPWRRTPRAVRKCLGAHAALASRASILRRARLAPSGPRSPNARTRPATRAGPEDQLGTGKWGRPQLQRPRRAHEGAPGEGERGHERGGGRRDRARAGHHRGHTRRRRRPSDACGPRPSRDTSRSPSSSTFPPPPFCPKTTTRQRPVAAVSR